MYIVLNVMRDRSNRSKEVFNFGRLPGVLQHLDGSFLVTELVVTHRHFRHTVWYQERILLNIVFQSVNKDNIDYLTPVIL